MWVFDLEMNVQVISTRPFNSPFLRMEQCMLFPFVACIIKPPGLYFVNIVCTSSMIELPRNLPSYTFSYTLVYSSSPILFGLTICLIVLLFHQTAAKSLQGETKEALASQKMSAYDAVLESSPFVMSRMPLIHLLGDMLPGLLFGTLLASRSWWRACERVNRGRGTSIYESVKWLPSVGTCTWLVQWSLKMWKKLCLHNKQHTCIYLFIYV